MSLYSTDHVILAVICSCCGGLEQPFHSAQLTCSVLLVVEVTKHSLDLAWVGPVSQQPKKLIETLSILFTTIKQLFIGLLARLQELKKRKQLQTQSTNRITRVTKRFWAIWQQPVRFSLLSVFILWLYVYLRVWIAHPEDPLIYLKIACLNPWC